VALEAFNLYARLVSRARISELLISQLS